MAINSTSQTKNENEGQTGCEACIKKDEIITDLYEALKSIRPLAMDIGVDGNLTKIFEIIDGALAKAEEK